MQKILRNAIQCRTCGDMIESTYIHDFKSCSCGRVCVDGGLDYFRRGFVESADDYIELGEVECEKGVPERKKALNREGAKRPKTRLRDYLEK